MSIWVEFVFFIIIIIIELNWAYTSVLDLFEKCNVLGFQFKCDIWISFYIRDLEWRTIFL